jgi:hypothetical protein
LRNYCTHSDINYLHYGLALYESLKMHSDSFVLYYLCDDEQTYEKLSSLSIPDIVPISLENLKKENADLRRAISLPPSAEARNVASRTARDPTEMQSYWMLTPYFTQYIMNSGCLDDILYIDADIYFFNSPEVVYEEVGNKSVGIVRHRIPYNPEVGEFNVGIVYFRNDLKGNQCLDWWRACLLDPNNEFYSTHGMCGDQKYLELFPVLFGEENVGVIDKLVGHIAPWNLNHQKYEKGNLVWGGNVQNLIYSHFSNFTPNYKNGTYMMAPRHGIPSSKVGIGLIDESYEEYFEATKRTRRIVEI